MIGRSLLVLALAFVLPREGLAQNQSSGLYLEGRLGAVFLNDSDFESDQSAAAGFDDVVEYDTGVALDFATGFAHDSGLRGEIAIGYRANEVDEDDDSPVTGTLGAFTFMANGYYDFYLGNYGVQGAWSGFAPFVGGGVGVAVLDADDDDEISDTVFAYQGVAGLYYGFTPHIGVSLAYAYFATSDIKDDDVELDYKSHNVLAGFRYTF